MDKIYSKIEKNKLLHLTLNINEIDDIRLDIAPEEEFLQLAILKMDKGKTFLPHKHNLFEKDNKYCPRVLVCLSRKS